MPTKNKQGTSFSELETWLITSQTTETTPNISLYERIAGSHTQRPMTTLVPGILGSHQDEPSVILQTGQLCYEEPLAEFSLAQPLVLTLNYLARDPHQSHVGQHWRLANDSQFEQQTEGQETLYRLFLSDGRKFDFQYDAQHKTFTDLGGLGAVITQHENGETEIRYHTGKKDYYYQEKIIRQEDQNHRAISFTYDDQQRLISLHNDENFSFLLHYNTSGLVSSIQDHGGRTWFFEYDKKNRLTTLTFPGNDQRHYQYTTQTEENGSLSSLLTSVTNSLGHSLLATTYDDKGRLISHDEDNQRITYAYHPNGSITRLTPCQNEHLYHLDPHGFICRIEYSIDHTQTYHHWDEVNNTLTLTDRTGAIESKVFDAQGRVLIYTDGQGEKTRFSYKGKNPKAITIESKKGKNSYHYDAQYNLLSEWDPKGRENRYTYNNHGDLTTYTDAEGRLQRIENNAVGLPTAVIASDGSRTLITYDDYGRSIETEDAEGRKTHVDYDHADRIIRSHEAHGKTEFRYANEGQLAAIINPAGSVTDYRYDTNGRLFQEETAEGIKEYQHKQGKLATLKYPDGKASHYAYNPQGRLIQEKIGDSTTDYDYNDDGRLIQVSDEHSTLTLAYTRTGRLETEHQDYGIVERAYANQSLSNISFLDESIQYQHNPQGILQSIRLNEQAAILLTHNKNDQLIARCYPNQQAEYFEQDATGTLIGIRTADQTLTYKTDKAGLIIQKNETQYTYNKSGWLIQAGQTHFSYDVAGNLLNDQARYETSTNRLLENRDYQFRYDSRGNLIQKLHKVTQAALLYTYDARNQLIRVQGDAIHGIETQQRDLHFSYDAMGRRTKKIAEGITQYYLYDQQHLVAILDEKQQRIATIVHDKVLDAPFSITSQQGAFYYHRDHQGSIIALTDAKGKVVERIEYDNHYGEIITHDKQVETHNPFGYTGRENDAPDLYYYRARYYDPQIKRFLSKDPIGLLSGDLNAYRYVLNDPVNWRDPTGLAAAKVKGPCAKLEKLKALKNKIASAGKKLFKKVGNKIKKRIVTTVASLAGGPLAIVAAGANIVMTGWDAWQAREEIGELFDAASEGYDMVASGDFEAGELMGELSDSLKSEIMGSASAGGLAGKLAEQCKKKKEQEGKDGNDGEGKDENKQSCKTCNIAGKPVNAIHGSKILFDEQDLDFSINAPISLIWQRHYDSENACVGVLGQGWTLLLDSHLICQPDTVIFNEPSGRALKFDTLDVGETSTWTVEQLTLSRPENEQYQLITGEGTTLVFTPSQIEGAYRLSSISDRNGNTLRYRYNHDKKAGNEDRLTHIMSDDDRIFALNYLETEHGTRLQTVEEWIWEDGQDRMTVPKSQKRVAYQYSDAGDLIQVKNHLGRITREFEYKNHILIAHKVPEGLESFYQYNEYSPQGKVTQNHTNTGESWSFDYLSQHTIVTDHSGRQTTYEYDKDKYLTATTDALGQRQALELDQAGLPEKIINEAGQEKSFKYDRRGNAVQITDIDGSTLQISYHDDFNVPVEISDDLGNTSTFEYDEKANLIKETTAEGATTCYQRDNRGFPVVITDPKGNRNTLVYDKTGNLIERTDCSGYMTHYQYDRDSNLTRITDALKQQTRYAYDDEHRLSNIHYSDGSTEHFHYNLQGQLTAYTDPKGHTTCYELDREGRPTKRINSLGGELGYQYDSHGRLTRLVNENNAEYKFAYDPLDRLIHEQGIDGLTTGYHYDPVGNVTEKCEDETGTDTRTTRFIRDNAGRLEEKQIACGELKSRTRYQYDELGQLSQARNEHSRIDLGYDVMGRLASETTATQNGEHTVSHRYDSLGNRIQTELPNGKKLNWLYYGSGHLHQINVDGELISDYERDALHREINRTQGDLLSTQSYDPLGRILQQQTLRQNQIQQHDKDSIAPALNGQSINNKTNNPIQIQRDYQYDQSGELTQLKDLRNGTTSYKYDKLGRITNTQQPSNKETFAFDPAHNLIARGDEAIKDNRLKVFEDKRYQYDTFGNMTEKKIGKHTQMAFSYDAEHQMKTVDISKNGITQSYQYAYDPFGRRISKTDSFNTTHFTWDGNRLLSETRGSQIKTYVYEQEGFVPVAQLDEQGIHYYHTDHLGTPRELTNSEGEITWEATYQTWGNTVKVSYQQVENETENETKNELAPAIQPLRFQGQYFDEETGLHYNRFRYYDPDVGRFVSQDPIGLSGGFNFYQYSPNPVSWIDPLGLSDIISGVNPNDINFSQGYVVGSEKIKKLTSDMKTGDFDWDRDGAALNVQKIDGQLVSGDNRRLLAAQEAKCTCSIIMRTPDEKMEGGGTYGKNILKKMNSKPKGIDVPKIDVRPKGTSTKPIIIG